MRRTIGEEHDLIGKCLIPIEEGVLLFRSSRVIDIGCGDGDYDTEREEFLSRVIPTDEGGRRHIHRLLRNGGFLQYHPDSPTNEEFNDSPSAIAELRFSLERGKGGPEGNVLAKVHAPCGKASAFKLLAGDITAWAKKARKHALYELRDLPVNLRLVIWLNHFHRDHPQGLVRFYEIPE